jgi:eukaryotic-like serine/threonine-protein kinase
VEQAVGPIGEAQEDLRPLSRLGPYELLGEWARGGMGALWAARHVETGQILGVKTLLASVASEHHFRWSFIDEAKLAARIKHRNVATVFGAGEDRGHLYCVMELVRGDSLRVLQRDAQARGIVLPPRTIAAVIAHACTGLHAAHELKDEHGALLGVVHRDISPHNILVATDGSVKLIDFGIAKAKDRLAADTSTGLIKGKIDFMAPEQVHMSKNLDRRTDVFCMGATLYSLLAGKPPYDSGESGQIATLTKLIEGAAIPKLPSTVPNAIAEIAYKALAHAPADRFADAHAMGRALDHAVRSLGPSVTDHEIAAFAQALLEERLRTREGRVFSSLQQSPPYENSDAAIVGQSQVRARGDSKQKIAFFGAVTLAVALGAVLVGIGVRNARARRTTVRVQSVEVRDYRTPPPRTMDMPPVFTPPVFTPPVLTARTLPSSNAPKPKKPATTTTRSQPMHPGVDQDGL